MIASRGMNASGSSPSYGWPGNAVVQFGDTRRNASQRSCQPPPSVSRRSMTTWSRPASDSSRLIARPLWPAPMIAVSTRDGRSIAPYVRSRSVAERITPATVAGSSSQGRWPAPGDHCDLGPRHPRRGSPPQVDRADGVSFADDPRDGRLDRGELPIAERQARLPAPTADEGPDHRPLRVHRSRVPGERGHPVRQVVGHTARVERRRVAGVAA